MNRLGKTISLAALSFAIGLLEIVNVAMGYFYLAMRLLSARGRVKVF